MSGYSSQGLPDHCGGQMVVSILRCMDEPSEYHTVSFAGIVEELDLQET